MNNEENKNLTEEKEDTKQELLSDVLNEENLTKSNAPIKGEKHSKLLYFILFILLLIIGCVIVIFVLNNLSK